MGYYAASRNESGPRAHREAMLGARAEALQRCLEDVMSEKQQLGPVHPEAKQRTAVAWEWALESVIYCWGHIPTCASITGMADLSGQEPPQLIVEDSANGRQIIMPCEPQYLAWLTRGGQDLAIAFNLMNRVIRAPFN